MSKFDLITPQAPISDVAELEYRPGSAVSVIMQTTNPQAKEWGRAMQNAVLDDMVVVPPCTKYPEGTKLYFKRNGVPTVPRLPLRLEINDPDFDNNYEFFEAYIRFKYGKRQGPSDIQYCLVIEDPNRRERERTTQRLKSAELVTRVAGLISAQETNLLADIYRHKMGMVDGVTQQTIIANLLEWCDTDPDFIEAVLAENFDRTVYVVEQAIERKLIHKNKDGIYFAMDLSTGALTSNVLGHEINSVIAYLHRETAYFKAIKAKLGMINVPVGFVESVEMPSAEVMEDDTKEVIADDESVTFLEKKAEEVKLEVGSDAWLDKAIEAEIVKKSWAPNPGEHRYKLTDRDGFPSMNVESFRQFLNMNPSDVARIEALFKK